MKDNISGKLIKVKSYINLEDIKKVDILIFDTDETILKDDGIYLLNIKKVILKNLYLENTKKNINFLLYLKKWKKIRY